MGAAAAASDAAAATRSAARELAQPRARRGGFLGWLIGVGFWVTLITLIVSACVGPGFAILALLPLAGMPYLLFCWIALTGDRNVE